MKKSMLLLPLSLFFFLLTSHFSFSHTEFQTEKTCPVCNTKFKVTLDASGSRFGMRLDLKPIGPIAAPWRVPVCTNCRFVIFKTDFTNEEIIKFKKLVVTDEYKKAAAENSSYFLLAKIYEYIQRDSYTIAFTYLQASWQVESNKEKHLKYLRLSLNNFISFLVGNNNSDQKTINSQMLAGELERRLSLFDEAKKRFTSIKDSEGFKIPILVKIIGIQLKLIDERNSEPQDIPRERR